MLMMSFSVPVTSIFILVNYVTLKMRRQQSVNHRCSTIAIRSEPLQRCVITPGGCTESNVVGSGQWLRRENESPSCSLYYYFAGLSRLKNVCMTIASAFKSVALVVQWGMLSLWADKFVPPLAKVMLLWCAVDSALKVLLITAKR